MADQEEEEFNLDPDEILQVIDLEDNNDAKGNPDDDDSQESAEGEGTTHHQMI